MKKVGEKSLTPENINQNFLNIKNAVRGPIVERASQIEKELEEGVKKPFDRVVRATIGDCHRIGLEPITFLRQVAALAACPQLASPNIPDDVKERVGELLQECKFLVGPPFISLTPRVSAIRQCFYSFLTQGYYENTVASDKVMHLMGPPYNEMEFASFHGCTKGWAAECGLRAGYVELVRIDPVVKKAFATARSVQQCPSVLGQCVLDCVMRAPVAGQASHAQFSRERCDIQRVLAEIMLL